MNKLPTIKDMAGMAAIRPQVDLITHRAFPRTEPRTEAQLTVTVAKARPVGDIDGGLFVYDPRAMGRMLK